MPKTNIFVTFILQHQGGTDIETTACCKSKRCHELNIISQTPSTFIPLSLTNPTPSSLLRLLGGRGSEPNPLFPTTPDNLSREQEHKYRVLGGYLPSEGIEMDRNVLFGEREGTSIFWFGGYEDRFFLLFCGKWKGGGSEGWA